MNKSNSIFVVFLISALVLQSHATFAQWEAMTQGVINNVTFVPPTPPNGFQRALLDFNDGIWIRSLEYQWISGSDALSCAPKSYLNSDHICQKDPRYWPAGGISASFCVPSSIAVGCTAQVYLGANIDCCYESSASDCDLQEQFCLTEYLDPEASM